MNTNRKVGTLMLVEVNKRPKSGQLRNTLIIFGGERLSITPNHYEESSLGVHKLIQPIIICDDEIKVGELYYNKDWYDFGSGLMERTADTKMSDKDKKILVLPNQFSQEFLQAIVDCKVENGDKVEVEMERTNPEEPNSWALYGKLKLRKDGTAIIHKYTENVEEAARKAVKGYDPLVQDQLIKIFIAGAEWQKNQKK